MCGVSPDDKLMCCLACRCMATCVLVDLNSEHSFSIQPDDIVSDDIVSDDIVSDDIVSDDIVSVLF